MEPRWRFPTILLHWGLSIVITLQLALSLFMWLPADGPRHTALQGDLLVLHEWFGLTATAIVLLHWLWSVGDKFDGGSLHVLFPCNRRAWQNIFEDLMVLRRMRLPLREPGVPSLGGLIHGLGLLFVSGMAITGTVIFSLLRPSGFQWPTMLALLNLHAYISALVWVYWLLHVGVAILHWLAGHDVVKPIFIRHSPAHPVTAPEDSGAIPERVKKAD